MKNKKTQTGFTIIELAIATLVFSVLLSICMTAFLSVGRLFVKGVNLSLTQQDARAVMDSIGSDIRFSNSKPVLIGMSDPTNPYFCVGQHRYKFILGYHIQGSDTAANYGLVREDVSSGCPPLSTPGSNQVEMLSNDMQLNDLHFGSQANGFQCSGKLCTITINLLFWGADDTVFTSSNHANDPSNPNNAALKDPDAHCFGNDLGSQFCASTSFTTTVLQNRKDDD